jgi:DNA-directed RNA polymerase subunit RPC12/RpoP
MPKLACRTCGRQVYTAAPLETLARDDRRCPRCGASLASERRLEDRRVSARRVNPPTEPGPPAAVGERRIVDRRIGRRRRLENGGWRPR